MNKILNPKEVLVIQMALSGLIEDLESTSKDQSIPFDPQSRKDMSEILFNAKSALKKVSRTSGHLVQLDKYVDGDDKQFLTKES